MTRITVAEARELARQAIENLPDAELEVVEKESPSSSPIHDDKNAERNLFLFSLLTRPDIPVRTSFELLHALRCPYFTDEGITEIVEELKEVESNREDIMSIIYEVFRSSTAWDSDEIREATINIYERLGVPLD